MTVAPLVVISRIDTDTNVFVRNNLIKIEKEDAYKNEYLPRLTDLLFVLTTIGSLVDLLLTKVEKEPTLAVLRLKKFDKFIEEYSRAKRDQAMLQS